MDMDIKEIEKKWNEKWEDTKLYSVDLKSNKPKYYNLAMFPYPSGDKLHIGHWYNFGIMDSFGRLKKMQGYNVFQPMGFDSFGLPAENYAIKKGVHPKISIKDNCSYMIKQLSEIGAIYDWDKKVVTSSEEYYKWTQWLFLKLFEHGLASQKQGRVNHCPKCDTVLANEQVKDGVCDRCDTEVIQKNLNQWYFKITDYAEDLLNYDGLLWPEKTIKMQENWIGKSIGTQMTMKIDGLEESFEIYTTRIDTVFGMTYCVLAPEHPLISKITGEDKAELVNIFLKEVSKKSDLQRTDLNKDKKGVFTGAFAINPFNNKKVPIYIADYVLMEYGTGALMAVPAHDERDMEFAKKHNIEIIEVISADTNNNQISEFPEKSFTKLGILINSGEFSGLKSNLAKSKMNEWLEKNNIGFGKTNYRLKDWLISRQRYWGCPIPIVHCNKCGAMPVSEQDLPVLLPDDVKFSQKGESPLKTHPTFSKTKCPKCNEDAEREVDTMDTFIDSSWYFLRYLSTHKTEQPFDKEILKKWMPVDMYVGGPEHACMHLLYARFINQFLYKINESPVKEPFKRLVHQGMITKGGAKMSKSKGNVVSPDGYIKKHGSDVFRMYLMFMGPFVDGGDWNDTGITGIDRFIDRFWRMINSDTKINDQDLLNKNLHKLIKKITEDLEKMNFNTAVAAHMEFVNFALKNGVDQESKKIAIQLIAPMAPHFAEECWEKITETYSVFNSNWPKYNKELIIDNIIVIGVQVNGKLRGEIEIPKDTDKEVALTMAKELENVQKFLEEGNLIKEIYVPGRIVNLVIK